MIDVLFIILSDLWHLMQTLTLCIVIGCLVAPITFGIYHYDKCKEEREQ